MMTRFPVRHVTLMNVWILSFAAMTTALLEPHSSKSVTSPEQMYLDVKPADTARFLQVVRALNISTYRLSYERSKSSKDRLRIGAIGPQVVELMPDAVELAPKRILPPVERGGQPITLHNIPIVNENTLFMYGVGATQELIRKVDALKDDFSVQVDRVKDLFGEAAKLEHILSRSSDGEAELKLRASIAEAEIARAEVEIEIKRAEDEKEYINSQRRSELSQIRRNEELTLSRLRKEEETARARTEEEMRLQFVANRQTEKVRNDNAEAISLIQYERELLLQNAAEKMKERTGKAIAEAKAEAERSNEDVHLRKLKAELNEKRIRNIAAINAVASHIASSLYSASKNPKQVLTFIVYMALLATGVYSAREIARLCRLIIESTLGRPKLIRATTRKSALCQFLCDARNSIKQYFQPKAEINVKDVFHDVALNPDLKKRILSISSAAHKVRKNDAPQRHILFYGEPGTGKTMVARKMAQAIGLDYAMMSGGDVGPLGPDAVTQIHSLFRWAKLSTKGVVLFIDEAEAFLGDRGKSSMSEDAHNALNALLYNTGSESKTLMMVLATNRAEDLDAAILDRCDETLLFPLPDAASRRNLVIHYFNLYVRSMHEDRREIVPPQTILSKAKMRMVKLFSSAEQFSVHIESDVMNHPQVTSIVKSTEGFSGREIAKLMISLQGLVYASEGGVLTTTMVNKLVDIKIDEHHTKIHRFGNSEALISTKQMDLSSDLEFESDISISSEKGEEVYSNREVSFEEDGKRPSIALTDDSDMPLEELYR